MYKNHVFGGFVDTISTHLSPSLPLSLPPSPPSPPSLSIQCQKDIVGGTHPVTKSEALQLAALQVQVDFGDWEEGRFKKGFLKSM